MQRGFGVWSMSRAVARELAVPDVRLWEAGIREQDVIQTTCYPNMPI